MKKKSSMQYYRENPESLKKKYAYDSKDKKKPERVKKRVEANQKNREAGTYGNGDGKDYDHAVNKMVSQKTNRGRKEKSRVKGYKAKMKK